MRIITILLQTITNLALIMTQATVAIVGSIISGGLAGLFHLAERQKPPQDRPSRYHRPGRDDTL